MNLTLTIFPLVIATGFSLAGCAGRHGSRKDLDLLTRMPWKYEKAGFDSNDDGIFDALDPNIARRTIPSYFARMAPVIRPLVRHPDWDRMP